MSLGAQGTLFSIFAWFTRGRRPLPPLSLPAEGEVRPLPAAPTIAVGAPGKVRPQPAPIRNRLAVARVFDSVHPVENRRGLFGRDRELTDLLEASLDLGQHIIVHGARGSGKTSLVRVFGDYADQQGTVVLYTAAEPDASFAALMRPLLRDIPRSSIPHGYYDAFARIVADEDGEFGPRSLVELLSVVTGGQVILILDEFDRVRSSAVKDDVAAFMKLLSDALSRVTLMLVGIASNVGEIIDSHPSLRRHMRVVPIGRIAPSGVEALITSGARALELEFKPEARRIITEAACGSPYHVRLFCSQAALAAIRTDRDVDGDAARTGLRGAIRAWEQTNEEDARILTAAVASGEAEDLTRIAREAAAGDATFTTETAGAERAASLVRGAVVPAQPGRLVFRDSVAPQFLLAMLMTREAQAAPVMAARQHVGVLK